MTKSEVPFTIEQVMEEFDCDRCGLDCGDEVYNMNDEFICDNCLTDDELAELEGGE